MKKIATALLCLVLAAGLAACAGPVFSAKTNRNNMLQVSPGMTEAQVVEIMGQPTFKDLYQNGDLTRVTYYYFTNEMGNKAFTASVSTTTLTRDDCTPVVFKNGVLVATGRYEKVFY